MLLASGYVVVQFYPWFNFSFLSFVNHYHTLPYPETKENKIWTKDKIEPQQLYQGVLYSTSRVRFNQLRCACSKIVWLSCTKLMRNHLLFGKKRQSPAWTVTNDQGTSETFGYFNKSTAWTFNREYPPTIWGGSHALYILSSYLYSIIFHSFVPLYKQLIAL